MSNNPNVIVGSVKVLGNFDLTCYTSWNDAIQGLAQNLGVELPVSKVTNVFVSNQQPSNSENLDIWFRLNNSGTFIGIFVYSNGEWVQVFRAPNEITILYGNSEEPPTGYVNTNNSANLTSAQKTALVNKIWNPAPSGLFYDIYTAEYVGVSP